MPFGLVIENWTVGLVYSLMIFMSWVSAVMTATDYVETKLKARYIGKADYLIEFDNIKDKYIMANMKADPIAVKRIFGRTRTRKNRC